MILKFTDTEVEYSNAKSARAWLRRNGMNVSQCTKNGNVWVFDFPLSGKVQFIKAPKCKIEPTSISTSREEVSRMPSILPNEQEEVAALPKLHRHKGPIYNTPVLGLELQPGDTIVNFAEYYDLTVDYRGVHKIIVPATDLTRIENQFMGFYSTESGGLLSYRIDSDATYDVVR